jgi:hypothetical protein
MATVTIGMVATSSLGRLAVLGTAVQDAEFGET